MVLAAATFRRPPSEAPVGMMPSPDHMGLHLSPHEQKECPIAALSAGSAAAAQQLVSVMLPEAASDEQVELRMTPRELRERRRRTIRSCMEVIESSMTSEDWARLKRLAKQGAVHYQAEEEFLFAPMMRRSQSAPNSSLAERYERLRSCTSPHTFRRPGHSALELTQQDHLSSTSVVAQATQPEAAQPGHLADLSYSHPTGSSPAAAGPSNVGDLIGTAVAATAATVPRRTSRAPTRIMVRSADAPTLLATPTSPTAPTSPGAGMLSETDSARASSPATQHGTDASMTDDSRASMDCLDSPTITLPRSKRGSDPHLDVEEDAKETKKKKKHRGLFHRRRRYTESESAEDSSSASPVRDRSWTQRVQHYMQNLLRRR